MQSCIWIFICCKGTKVNRHNGEGLFKVMGSIFAAVAYVPYIFACWSKWVEASVGGFLPQAKEPFQYPGAFLNLRFWDDVVPQNWLLNSLYWFQIWQAAWHKWSPYVCQISDQYDYLNTNSWHLMIRCLIRYWNSPHSELLFTKQYKVLPIRSRASQTHKIWLQSFWSFWNLTDALAAMLPRHLSNLRMIWLF